MQRITVEEVREGSAAGERAQRELRRAGWAREVAQGAQLRAMTGNLGDDPTGAAVLGSVEAQRSAQVEGAPLDVAQVLDAVRHGSRSARSYRGTLDRAAQRERARMREIADAGLAPVVERRPAMRERLLSQAGRTAEAPQVSTYVLPLGSVGVIEPRGKRPARRYDLGSAAADVLDAWTRVGIPDVLSIHRERGGRAIVVRVLDAVTPRGAALAADGPVARADHDAATCAAKTCRRCGRGERGQLAGALDAQGRRKVAAADRAPNERYSPAPADLGKGRKSTDGQTAQVVEASLPRMMDATRAHHAQRVDSLGAQVRDLPSVEVLAIDAATTSSAGQRGYRVDLPTITRAPSVRGAGARRAAQEAAHAVYVDAAAQVAARYLPSAQVARWAQRAGVSAAQLATAWARFSPEPADAYAAQRPSYRARKRSAGASAPDLRPLYGPHAVTCAGRPLDAQGRALARGAQVARLVSVTWAQRPAQALDASRVPAQLRSVERWAPAPQVAPAGRVLSGAQRAQVLAQVAADGRSAAARALAATR